MSKNNIGKKLLALVAIGAAIGGVIAFFKKFEKEEDRDFDFNSFQVPTGNEYCDADSSRNYTTIAGEKENPDDSEADDHAQADEEESTDAAPQDGQEDALNDAVPQDDQEKALNDDGETPDNKNETFEEDKTEETKNAAADI